jgi:hypothetical protein
LELASSLKSLAKKGALAVFFSVRLRPDEAREVRVAIDKSGTPQAEWIRDRRMATASRAES